MFETICIKISHKTQKLTAKIVQQFQLWAFKQHNISMFVNKRVYICMHINIVNKIELTICFTKEGTFKNNRAEGAITPSLVLQSLFIVYN